MQYTEVERGRFDVILLRQEYGVRYAVAYTDYDVVKLEPYYHITDKPAVEKFAKDYDLPIDWRQ